jgi:hypothetical protein
VSKNEIVKRPPSSVKEKGQYAVAFSLVGVMLYVAGFPIFFLLFVGVLSYFVWKIFSSEGRNDVRRIFDFYLSAHAILREDYRRWYGFEIHETIARGEKIVRAIPGAPPLVHFALGALYDRLGDHASAVKHLSYISEEAGEESGIVFPSNELREYVRILRKIERTPAEAPQTSAAIRSLERLRKGKCQALLEVNRAILASETTADEPRPHELKSVVDRTQDIQGSIIYADPADFKDLSESSKQTSGGMQVQQSHQRVSPQPREQKTTERQTISEVLHDIYDKSVQ